MMMLYDQILDAVAAMRAKWGGSPTVGIILGTGLGNLADEIRVEAAFRYEDLPHFLQSHRRLA